MKIDRAIPQRSCRSLSVMMLVLALAVAALLPCISMAEGPSDDPKGIVDIKREGASAPAPPSVVQTPPRQAPAPAVRPPGREAPALGKGNLYALVVGISTYREPKLCLKVSDNDAKAFAEFLQTQKKVFRNVRVTTLLNEDATKVAVEKQLNHELPAAAGKDDTVVLFFSGHGSGDRVRPGEYYFLTHDTEPKYLEATAVKMSGLHFLKRLNAGRVLVIADACQSGDASEQDVKAAEQSLDNLTRQFSQASGKAIMTSSKSDEFSREKPSLNHSIFTYYLLQGLKGEADTDRTGVVTLQGLYDYVYDRTRRETDGKQNPQLESKIVGSFPIAVAGELKNHIQLEVSVVAQDPRCTNQTCTDPPQGNTRCTDPLCGDVPITDGSTMYTRQNYQIAFRPSSTSYVYVYHIGSKGDIHRLFPGKKFLGSGNNLENPLKGGRIYWIPGKHSWLRQDDLLGDEKIYVVASRTKNGILEDLYGHLEKLREQGATAEQSKLVQNDLEAYLDVTMSPTMEVLKKAEYTPGDAGNDPKARTFENLSRFFYSSSGLDAVKSISIHHVGR